MDLIPAPSEISRIPMWHLAWNEVAEGLKINLEMSHRCHAYYMSRIWYHDVSTSHPKIVLGFSRRGCRLCRRENLKTNGF